MRLVILESPYAGNIEKNVAYARACVRDSLSRGEAPIASHLLYTQPASGVSTLGWRGASKPTRQFFTAISASRAAWNTALKMRNSPPARLSAAIFR